MIPPSLICRIPLLCAALLVPTGSIQAGSIEKIPATPEDIAGELGIELDKFEAKFDTPVYATLQLSWKQPGMAEAKAMQHTSADPDQYHEVLFVRKDFGQMQLKTGGANAKQVRDIIEMNVRFGSTGFFYRDVNPFAKIKLGQTLQAWSKHQSREALPLDELIPLVISAGPLDAAKPMKNLLQEYRSAPAFIALSVAFSKTPPPAPAEATPTPAPVPAPQAK